ncbi:unnamed protein product [Triticum aestivum]|uniref:Aminotransferase-like plant mobile domain-containing protein n=2 Tax=Triticum aestivum TaxID=4565 RepID=A0A9R1EW21_WHEAT|nr:uncharacterized protein LOC123049671 [Triticum aestivum]KAF7017496.1 hypothetical protein CFC21_030932 [Triticum aestivum]SPT19200.1 unnamed protein product [Triticum aestivum]
MSSRPRCSQVYESRKKGLYPRSAVDSSFAPKDVYEVAALFSDAQRDAVGEIGLVGMLEVANITHVDREYCWSLFLDVDLKRGALKIDDDVYVTFNEVDIHNILGIALGGDILIEKRNVPPSPAQVTQIREYLGLCPSSFYVTIGDIRWALKKPCQNPFSEADKIRTQVGFAMLCMASCFSPRENRQTVPTEAYAICMDPANLHRVNWGRYVHSELIGGAEKVHEIHREGKRPQLYGCPLVLQALRFDSVDTGTAVKPEPLVRPRIKFYTAFILSRLIHKDTVVGSVPKRYGVMKARRMADQSLPWNGQNLRSKIQEAKAFIDRSLKEHALASAERNTLFFRKLSALNDGTIACMNENMHREIEKHLACL